MDVTMAINTITTMQNNNKINENIVLSIFTTAFNQKNEGFSNALEEIKHCISDKRDYHDMIDLMRNLSKTVQIKMYDLFHNNVIPKDSKYKYIVVSDIDNTAIENISIAKCKYINNELIPGYQLLLHLLTQDATSVTFISARPKQLEKATIASMAQKIDSNIKWSLLPGNTKLVSELFIAKLLTNKSSFVYEKMGEEKMKSFQELALIYPHCTFIFFGDDTQGDYIFARKMTSKYKNSIAFIRKCKHPNNEDFNDISSNIFLHSSYFEVIYKLISEFKIIPTSQIQFIIDYVSATYNCFAYDNDQVQMDVYYLHLINTLISP